MRKDLRVLPLALLTFLSLVVSPALWGEGGDTMAQPVSPVRVELISEQRNIAPGHPFWVALHFSLEDGWHIYWKNPGDAGLAPEIQWELPEGFRVGELQWPYPKRLSDHGLVGFGYEGEAVLLAEIVPTAALVAGRNLDIRAEVQWVACGDSCVPGSTTAAVSLPVAGVPRSDGEKAALFDRARLLLPHKLADSELRSVSVRVQGSQLMLELGMLNGVEAVTAAYFFPHQGGVIALDGAQELAYNDERFTLALPALTGAHLTGGSLSGVLLLADGDGRSFAVDIAVPVSASLASSRPALDFGSFVWYLLLAFLGGAVLNLMPCVLPVISLKILGFINLAGSDRKKIMHHGVLFSLGVLASFWVLAGILLTLRASGQYIGWGFQLQEPFFVLLLSMILFLLGLSLLGVFELGTGLAALGGGAQAKLRSGALGTFFSGVLATLVATPCTGPFLAPTLGLAVTLPPLSALLFFSVMGLGLTLPYLLLSLFPKWVRWLPRPGRWMVTFKQIMGFLMLATVIWLLWVFNSHVTNVPWAVAGILGCLLLLGAAAWLFGRFGTPVQRRLVRYGARLVTAVLIALGVLLGLRLTREGEAFAKSSAGLTAAVTQGRSGWLPWDAQRLQELRTEGHPVFVDFTAKWCLICQVNKAPLSSSKVRERFKDLGVVMMEADWTRRDPKITAELERFGRTGVPLYVLYSGESDAEPIVLPQVLTSENVLDYLDQLS